MGSHVGGEVESRCLFLDKITEAVIGEVAFFRLPKPTLRNQQAQHSFCNIRQKSQKVRVCQ